MTQAEFLEQHVFTDLKNINDDFDSKNLHFFSEADFAKVLQQAEHYGIGIYGIEPWLDGKVFDVSSHGDHNKKATDARWYKKAFNTFKHRQEGLLYSASYKVSPKLLARQ